MNEEVQQTQRPVVTQAIVTARFNTELTKLKYQEALDNFNKMVVTSENTATIQEHTKRVRAFIRKLTEIKAAGKRDALAECDFWDNAYNNILKPLQTSLVAKENELQIIMDKIAAEEAEKEKEKQRIDAIKKLIDNFLLDVSRDISDAKTAEDIISIEKTIGSHKGNKSRYQEFLPTLVERSAELIPLIKQQKQHIRDMTELEAEKNKAIENNDDRKIMELEDKQQEIQHTIDGSRIGIQERAIQMATTPDTETVFPQAQAVKYRRSSWKWEVVDVNLLYKKMPHLVELTPNKEKLDDMLRNKKADGSLDKTEEVVINGIRFFLDKRA